MAKNRARITTPLLLLLLQAALSGCAIYHSADRDYFNSNATYGAPASSSQAGISVDKKCSWTTRAQLDASEAHPSAVKPGWVLGWTISQAQSELHILAIEQPQEAEDAQSAASTIQSSSTGAALCDVIFSREDPSAGPIDQAESLAYTKSLVEIFSSGTGAAHL